VSLASIVRSAVKIVDRTTKTLQVEVTHLAWIGQSADGYGTPIFAGGVKRLAIVDQQQRPRLTSAGEEIFIVGYVCFVRPLPPNGATGRVEPVDRRDRIVLPDGSSGPIVDVNSFLDPATGRGYITEIWIGSQAYQAVNR